ncbi:MAG: Cof-type HAD-IIB family hydrolase [Oscillospiraceae bacterium]|nr:Cof-type HAD-IIB family hydrolase [Oscillospiraceae bacterium]
MIQAVFLDIDNTLTSSVTRAIPQSALEAIARARANGVRVFAATGRNTRTPEEGAILRGVTLDGCVALNGQICYLADDTIVFRRPLDARDVATAQRYCDARGCAYLVSELNENYINRISQTVLDFQAHIRIPLYAVHGAQNLSERDIYAFSPFLDRRAERELLPQLTHSTAVRYNEITCDIIPREGGKDVGILKMLAHLGIPACDSMAFGDGGNDIAMLRAAGVGVAMAGSAPDVLAAADYVAESPDADGIYRTFALYKLI